MPKWIALFRAINVGGRNKMPMRKLQTVMTSIGCVDIQTYIQSGNVVFSSALKTKTGLNGRILDAVELEFGFRPQLLLLTETEFQDAIERCPFEVEGKDPKTVHFFFLEKKPSSANVEGLAKLATKTETFELVGSVFYLAAPDSIAKSKLAAAVERQLGVTTTARNYNTIAALRAMLEGTTTP
jgi:uncharacterized protein (DUF1697 family)